MEKKISWEETRLKQKIEREISKNKVKPNKQVKRNIEALLKISLKILSSILSKQFFSFSAVRFYYYFFF